MSEWSNVPVLKTGEGYTSGGSNPPLPAIPSKNIIYTNPFNLKKLKLLYTKHYIDTKGFFMYKFILFVTLFIFQFTGCTSPQLSGANVKKEYFTGGQIRSELIMDDSMGKSGVLKKYGYNGKVTSIVTIHNSVKDGIETWFDPEERLIRKVPYVNGRIHGTLLELYENGDTMVSIPFTNGTRNGMAKSYKQDGSVYKTVIYKNGKIIN